MSCERFRKFDVEAFLIDSESAEFESFRMHLFDCAACSASLEEWTAFERALSQMDDDGLDRDAHPEPDHLELFGRAQDQMGDEAMVIEAHVNFCRSCQAELSALAQFESGFLAAANGSSPLAEVTETTPSFLGGLRDQFRLWNRGFGFAAPVFATALVMIMLGVWLSGVLDSLKTQPSAMKPAPQIVRETPAPERAPAPHTPEPPESTAPGQFALGSEEPESNTKELTLAPERLPEDPSVPEPGPIIQQAPEQIAQVAPVTVSPKPMAPTPRQTIGGDELLLAALTTLPLPDYAAPVQAGSTEWMRQFGAVRSGPVATKVETRAPQNHAGLALSAEPRLWWNLSQETSFNIEVTVVDDREIDPIANIKLAGPFSAGLHQIDLAERGVSLKPNVEYRWFVSLIVDPDRPSRNPVAAGALRVLDSTDQRRNEAKEASPSERGHVLAKLGIWYDAYDFFASISKSHPEQNALARHHEHLTKTAGGE